MIFAAAVTAGVTVHFLFLAAGLVPDPSTAQVAEVEISLDYKLVLNVLATVLFLGIYRLRSVDVEGDSGSGVGG